MSKLLKISSYSIEEEVINSALHIIGVYISVIFTTLLCQTCYMSQLSGLAFTSLLIYGVSTCLMFTMSSLYHAIQHLPSKRILKILDHIAIYFAIAGMNTPICYFLLSDKYLSLCTGILTFQWICVIFGIIFKIFTTGKYQTLSTCFYTILGWMTILSIKPIIEVCNTTQLCYLGIGGLLYSVGAIFYSIKSIKYFHCIWHLFVLIAAIFHFMFIFSIANS